MGEEWKEGSDVGARTWAWQVQIQVISCMMGTFLSLSFLICEMGIMMPGPETMCRLERICAKGQGHCPGTGMVPVNRSYLFPSEF